MDSKGSALPGPTWPFGRGCGLARCHSFLEVALEWDPEVTNLTSLGVSEGLWAGIRGHPQKAPSMNLRAACFPSSALIPLKITLKTPKAG